MVSPRKCNPGSSFPLPSSALLQRLEPQGKFMGTKGLPARHKQVTSAVQCNVMIRGLAQLLPFLSCNRPLLLPCLPLLLLDLAQLVNQRRRPDTNQPGSGAGWGVVGAACGWAAAGGLHTRFTSSCVGSQPSGQGWLRSAVRVTPYTLAPFGADGRAQLS